MKKTWTPTQNAFREFLEWLEQGAGSSGEIYLELRRRLVFYFDRRNCREADELADETLSRVAQTFQEKGEITNLSPAHYCYVTARFVFLEYIRQAERSQASLEDVPASRWESVTATQPGADSESTTKEMTFGCLERCLGKLSPAERELILEYYQGELQEKIQRRKEIARRLGLSANALSIRACRIRDRLESCVRSCREGGEAFPPIPSYSK